MKITPRHDYTKAHDILGVGWGFKNCKCEYSEEVSTEEGHRMVLDYDQKGRIIGIEIFDWNKGSASVRRKVKK